MNTKNPILIAAIVTVVAAAGFYKFGLALKRKEATAAKGKVEQAQARLDAARQLLTSNEQARQTYRKDYSTVVRLGKAVPGDDDVRSLVVQLDNAANRTHVDFQSIEVGTAAGGSAGSTPTDAATAGQLPPGATVGPAGFPIMPFSFTFRGGFFRLGAFFQRLDKLVKTNNDKVTVTGRLLTVDSVKLEPDGTGFPNIKATVQATSYLTSPLEGATGGASPAGPTGTTAAPAAPGAAGAPAPPVTTTATSTGVIR